MSPRTRKILIFMARMALALAGVALLWAMVLRGQDAAWERLQRGEPLRVALDPSFPPFEDVGQDGQLVGFDVDLANEIGKRLDVPVTFIPIGFDGLADAVMAGRADAVISAFPYDERLTQDVRYSRPYFEAGLVMVTRPGSDITTPDQLADALVAVEWGSLADSWVRQQKLPQILRMDTADEALKALQDGKADVVIVDATSAALFPDPSLVVHPQPLISEPYVIVSPKDTPKLGQAIDETLGEIIQDGTWRALAEKYFPNPPIPPGKEAGGSS